MEKQFNNEGFSLVELLVAIAISLVVLSTILALLTYSSNQMADTQAKVKLQDESKDMVNHITNVAMEGSKAEWKNESGIDFLVIENDSDAAEPTRKEVVYWHIGTNVYFASTTEVSLDALTADKMHLLAESVASFKGEVKENEQSKRKIITLDIKMANERASMECSNNVYLRNQ